MKKTKLRQPKIREARRDFTTSRGGGGYVTGARITSSGRVTTGGGG